MSCDDSEDHGHGKQADDSSQQPHNHEVWIDTPAGWLEGASSHRFGERWGSLGQANRSFPVLAPSKGRLTGLWPPSSLGDRNSSERA